MALDKAVDAAQLDADLTAIADAIRAKGGTSEALSFPNGFVSAVGAIQGGVDRLVLHVAGVPFDYVDNETETLREYAFTRSPVRSVTMNAVKNSGQAVFSYAKNLESVSFENIANIPFYFCEGCTSLKTVYVPNCKGSMGRNAFYGCTSLETIDLPKVTSCYNDQQFYGCTSLISVYLKGFTGTMLLNGFSNCKSLEIVDLGDVKNIECNFTNCYMLNALILRKTDATVVCKYDPITTWTTTPLGGYNGTYGGHVYVPEALIPEYQVATNWSALYAAYPEIFQPIEGSEYE